MDEKIDSLFPWQTRGINDDRIVIESTKPARPVFNLFLAYFNTESSQCFIKDFLNITLVQMITLRNKDEKSVSVTTAAAAATAPATAAITTWWSRARLIHGNRTTTKVSPIESVNGCYCLIIVKHLHETKTFRTAGIAIGNNPCRFDLPKSLKSDFKFIFGLFVAKIAYIDVHILSRLLTPWISFTQKSCPGSCVMIGSYHISMETAHFLKNSAKSGILSNLFKKPVRTW